MLYHLLLVMATGSLFHNYPAGTDNSCLRQHPPMHSSDDGNFTIIGLFPVYHDREYDFTVMQWIEAMKFAVAEGNEMLRNAGVPVSVGYTIFDTCTDVVTVTEIAMELILDINSTYYEHEANHPNHCCNHVVENRILGLVGPSYSKTAIQVAYMLIQEPLPIISYTATSTRLSNPDIFPSFMRTIPSDNYQANAVVDILEHYNWSFVSLIVYEDDYGMMGRRYLLDLLKAKGLCVDLDEFITNNNETIDRVLKLMLQQTVTTANVTILWLYENTMISLFRRAQQLGLRKRLWIATEGIGSSPKILQFNDIIVDYMTILPFSGIYRRFENYFWNVTASPSSDDAWLRSVFYRINNNSQHEVKSARLGDHKYLFMSDALGNVRNAVMAFFHAFLNYTNDHPICRTAFCESQTNWNNRKFMDQYVRPVQFPGLHNELVSFDKNGDIVGHAYHINVAQRDKNNQLYLKHVGGWSSNHKIFMTEEFRWNTDKGSPVSRCSTKCEPGYYAIINARAPCCWNCVPCPNGHVKNQDGNHKCRPCPDGTYANTAKTRCIKTRLKYFKGQSVAAVFLYILILAGITMSLAIMVIYIKNRKTPVVSASHFYMSFIQVTAQSFLFASLLLHVGYPNKYLCVMQTICTALPLTLIFAITFVKTELLLRIFHMRHLFSHRNTVVTKSVASGTTAFIVTVDIVIITLTLLLEPSLVQVSYSADRTVKTIACRRDGLLIIQNLYIILLSIICGIQAYRVRQLPANFNEATFISFAMFITTTLLILWIPLHSSEPDLTQKSFITAFIAYTVNLAILVLMHGQRVYVVLCIPQRNNIEILRVSMLKYMEKKVQKEMETLVHKETSC